MIKRIIEDKQITYLTEQDKKVIVTRNPKLTINFLDIYKISINEFLRTLNYIIADIGIEEPICLDVNGNIDLLKSIIVINKSKKKIPIVYKLDINETSNIDELINLIEEYHLPVILNYHIGVNEKSLEKIFQKLKQYDEYVEIDSIIKSELRKYKRKIEVISLTKHVQNNVNDSPFDKANFLYFLDRFKFKVQFSGTSDTISDWKKNLEEYYQSEYLLPKYRMLKVV